MAVMTDDQNENPYASQLVDPSRRHAFDVIVRRHILILGVDPAVKQYASTTVT